MKKIEIFEPAMCCSTGVCGPSVDPELLRISTAVDILNKKGIEVKRYNLTNNPEKFLSNSVINEIVTSDGGTTLPVTLLEGEVVKKNNYPSNNEIYQWLGIDIKNVV